MATTIAKEFKEVFEVKTNLQASNNKYKDATDSKRKHNLFRVGDKIIVFLRRERFSVGPYGKLQLRKYDSFEIPYPVNENGYGVDLPSEFSMSKTFTVAEIFEFHEDEGQLSSSLEDERTASGGD